MTDNQKENFRNRFRSIRSKLRLNQGEFAQLVGITQPHVSAIESGRRNITGDIKLSLKANFNVNLNWLDNGIGEMFLQAEENNANQYFNEGNTSALADDIDGNNYVAELVSEYELHGDKAKIFGIPIYNMPASASNVELYADARDLRIIGHLGIPGATIGSFALPVYGHSMYPTMANGYIAVLRPISQVDDIEWGNIYYIEYGDYRVFKRLLKDEDDPQNVILWSDNQTEIVGGRPKYASKTIKAERIRRLCLVTDLLEKPNY